MIGLFGGAFDPPHNGHVALSRAARETLGLAEIVVLVSADPAHKRVDTPVSSRLELAAAAFPGDRIVRDTHPRTIDTLRAHPEWSGAFLLIGADQFLTLPDWKEPDAVLDLVEIAVATRPGTDQGQLEAPSGSVSSRSIRCRSPQASCERCWTAVRTCTRTSPTRCGRSSSEKACTAAATMVPVDHD
jgi:nicotinate (nicotinamide) nucleotide adenylyltransferase